jgi:hypothetical protein
MSDTRSSTIAMDARTNVATHKEGVVESGSEAAKQRLVSSTMTMDARTIVAMLNDVKSIGIDPEDSKYRVELEARYKLLEAQSKLKTYFQSYNFSATEQKSEADSSAPLFHSYTLNQKIANAKTEYAYRLGSESQMRLMLHKAPVDGRDFYELAMSLSGNARGYYDELYYLMPAQKLPYSKDERAQQVVAYYQTKLDELAEEYLTVLAGLNANFETRKAAAILRYQQSMQVATPKTAVAFKKNYGHEIAIAEGALFAATQEKSGLNNAAINEIKAAEARELESLSAEEAPRTPMSYEELVYEFQANLLRDAEHLGVKFLFSYKAGSMEEVALYSLKHPETPDDFYELAMRIKAGKDRFQGGYFDVYHYGEVAKPEVLKAFMYNILSDAAKAGHPLAKNALIEAVMQGDKAARNHVTLKEYPIHGISIMLPRTFKSAQDLGKLGSDLLKAHRDHKDVVDQPLVGPYFELANGKDAEFLGKYLRKLSDDIAKREAEENAKRAYADQSSRVAQNSSAMFTASFATSARMSETYLSSLGYASDDSEENAKSPDASILSTGSPVHSSASAGGSGSARPLSPTSAYLPEEASHHKVTELDKAVSRMGMGSHN